MMGVSNDNDNLWCLVLTGSYSMNLASARQESGVILLSRSGFIVTLLVWLHPRVCPPPQCWVLLHEEQHIIAGADQHR